MRKLLFAIRDVKSETFTPLAEFTTRMEAIRSLDSEVRNPESTFAKYAEDFALFEMGSFDKVSGKIEVHAQPVHVINAYELRPGAGVRMVAEA